MTPVNVEIIRAARRYERKLRGRDVLIYSQTGEDVQVIEARFDKASFAHLVGIRKRRESCPTATELYERAVAGSLRDCDWEYTKSRVACKLKLEIAPAVFSLSENVRQTGRYLQGSLGKVRTDKIVGRDHVCVGFVEGDEKDVPNTALAADFSELVDGEAFDVAFVMQKRCEERRYQRFTYINEELRLGEQLGAAKDARAQLMAFGIELADAAVDVLESRWGPSTPPAEPFADRLVREGRLQSERLPGGWTWTYEPDGSGCLEGPNGERFFEFDLQAREARDGFGRRAYIAGFGQEDVERRERWIEERYLPEAALAARLEKCSIKDLFTANAAHRFYADVGKCRYVAVSPEYAVDAESFGEMARTLRTREVKGFSDHVSSDFELAGKVRLAVEAGQDTFWHDGETVAIGGLGLERCSEIERKHAETHPDRQVRGEPPDVGRDIREGPRPPAGRTGRSPGGRRNRK